MRTLANPIHPGKFIKLAFMEPLGISVSALADRLMISKSTLSRLLNGKIDIDHAIAIRLSCVLGRSEQSWVNLQTAYNTAKQNKIDASIIENFLHSENCTHIKTN